MRAFLRKVSRALKQGNVEGVSSLLTICSTTNHCTSAGVTSLTVTLSGVLTSALDLEDDVLNCGKVFLVFG